MTWQPRDELASAVALEVLIHGPLGRAELARRLGLAPATLTRISTELIASGLLAEVPEATQRTSGRPTIPLDVVPSSHYFLGIKLTDSALDATVIDLKATPRDSYRVPLESLTPVRVVRAIADLAHRAHSSYHLDAIGIAVGGIVNGDGTVESAPFLKWRDVPLASLVSEAAHLPTFVANDLSAYTQIQHWFGSGTGHSNFAVITVGVGVGYGCVANGARLENEDSGIGLIGHWPLDPLGPICSQGHRGCAEAMLGRVGRARPPPRVERRHRTRLRQTPRGDGDFGDLGARPRQAHRPGRVADRSGTGDHRRRRCRTRVSERRSPAGRHRGGARPARLIDSHHTLRRLQRGLVARCRRHRPAGLHRIPSRVGRTPAAPRRGCQVDPGEPVPRLVPLHATVPTVAKPPPPAILALRLTSHPDASPRSPESLPQSRMQFPQSSHPQVAKNSRISTI